MNLFKEQRSVQYEEITSYSFAEYISDLGGAAGLVLGSGFNFYFYFKTIKNYYQVLIHFDTAFIVSNGPYNMSRKILCEKVFARSWKNADFCVCGFVRE